MTGMLRRAQRAGRMVRGLAASTPDDIYLASFPKSGNTWMKYVIATYHAQLVAAGDGASLPEALTFAEANEWVPELGVNSHKTRPYNPGREAGFRFVKTHLARSPLLANRRAILLIRDPRKVMVSYYHFCRSNIRIRYTGDFADFIRHPRYGLRAWSRHTCSWAGHARILHYERLLEQPRAELAGALADLIGSIDEQVLTRAVRMGERSRMAELERRDPSVAGRQMSGYAFVGIGDRGNWDTLTDSQDRYLLNSVIREWPPETFRELHADWVKALATNLSLTQWNE